MIEVMFLHCADYIITQAQRYTLTPVLFDLELVCIYSCPI